MWHMGYRGFDFFNRFEGMENFGWIGGIVMFIGFIALVGVIIYLIVRKNRGYAPYVQTTQQSSAQEILKERLAKGEIDIPTFDELSKKIR